MLERKKHPLYNDTDGYVCAPENSGKYGVWRNNPEERGAFEGYIGLDEGHLDNADKHQFVLKDEQFIQKYMDENYEAIAQNLNGEKFEKTKIIELILKAIHHPNYFPIDKNAKHASIDLVELESNRIPQQIQKLQEKKLKSILDKFDPSKSDSAQYYIDYFGDGFTFIVFNCTQPQYLYPNKDNNVNSVLLNMAFQNLAKQNAYCKDDGIWRVNDEGRADFKDSYFTYDARSESLGTVVPQSFYEVLINKTMCDDYMRFLNHPAYFNQSFKKPVECRAESKEPNQSSIKNNSNRSRNNRKPDSNTITELKEHITRKSRKHRNKSSLN